MYLPHTQPHTNVTISGAAHSACLFWQPPPSLPWQAGALRVTQQAQCKLIYMHEKSCLPQGPELFLPLLLAGWNSTKFPLCAPSVIVCSSNYIITQLMSLHHLTNPWQNCSVYLIMSVAHPLKLQPLPLPPKANDGKSVQRWKHSISVNIQWINNSFAVF